MDALDKTKQHEHTWLPIEVVLPNEHNPNKMSKRQFNLLVQNIEKKGVTEDIEVRDLGNGTYRIIGGHHRYKACKYLGWDQVPVVINRDPELDDEQETFQLVRMNVIHGKLDPEKFVKLYEQLSKKYSKEVLQESFGFADQKEFDRLIEQTAEALPKELKAEFKEAAKEIKTIDDLSKILKRLLDSYGDTLDYGYMIFDFNGTDSIWCRMKKRDRQLFDELGVWCRTHKRAMDDVIVGLLKEFLSSAEYETLILDSVSEIDFTLPNHVLPLREVIDGQV